MTDITVDPPEYYPIVEKFFVDGIREALETLGAELLSVKTGARAVNNEVRLAFVFEVSREDGFVPLDLDPIVSEVLQKLVEDANRKFGKFQGVRFRVMGFKIVERRAERRKEEARLIIDCPGDLRRTLERLGKGLMIYLRDREVNFTSLALKVPDDGKPRLSMVLLLKEEAAPYEKVSLERSLEEKASSYLRTLNADYISVEARVLDPSDEKVARVVEEKEKVERQAEEIVKDDDVREIMEALGRWPHGN